MTTVDSTRSAWLAERRNGLGASDIAAVLNLSPWTSRYSLWADKVGLLPLDDEPNEGQEFGLMAEQMLASYFTKRTGLYVAGEQMTAVHPDFPWMRCSLDGLVFDGKIEQLAASVDDAIAAAEWKTTGDSAAEWEANGVPPYYQTQATWTSIVTGLDTVWFGVLHLAFGRPQFRTYEFTPDADDKAVVIEAARRFWEDNVCAGVPPEVDGTDATTDALRSVYAGDTELDAVEADDDLLFSRRLIVDYKADIKRLEESIGEHENRIRAALGDHTVLTAGVDAKGKPVVAATWKPGERTTLDTTEIKARRFHIPARYYRTTPTRTLLVKAPKAAA